MIVRMLLLPVCCFLAAAAGAAAPEERRRIVPANPQARRAMEYWTAERIASAVPLEMVLEEEEPPPPVLFDIGGGSEAATGATKPAALDDIIIRRRSLANPANGTKRKGPHPAAAATAAAAAASPRDLQQVRNEDWTHGGKVQNAVGRIFISNGGSNYFCTGTVVPSGYSDRAIILTCAHCVFDVDTGAFHENWAFIPNQDGTSHTKSDADCTNDPVGCWYPTFAIIDRNYADGNANGNSFFRSAPWDYAYLVVPSSGAHAAGISAVDDDLDEAVSPIDIDFTDYPMSEEVYNVGYPKTNDPYLRYCNGTLTTSLSAGYFIDECDLSGGASGGAWILDASGNGPIISVHSYSLFIEGNRTGNGGPRLSLSSAQAMFVKAGELDFNDACVGSSGGFVLDDNLDASSAYCPTAPGAATINQQVTYYKANEVADFGYRWRDKKFFCEELGKNMCSYRTLCPDYEEGVQNGEFFGEPNCGAGPDGNSVQFIDVFHSPTCTKGYSATVWAENLEIQQNYPICEPYCSDLTYVGEDIIACCEPTTNGYNTWVPGFAGASASCGGDPHFSTWSNRRFNYHGQCDLVYVKNNSFQEGTGLNVHVRTKIESIYSIIAGVAIKVGSSVFEFEHETVGEPKIFLDGVGVGDEFRQYEHGPFRITKNMVHNKDFDKNILAINVHFGGHNKLSLHVLNQWVFLSVDAVSKDMIGSVGLAGSFPAGEMLDRTGNDLSHDRNAYGGAWQVQPEEPQLFRTTPKGHPQAPHSACRLPEIDAHEFLRTENADLYRVAVEACQKEGMTGLDLDDCTFDVVILRNPMMAAAWWGAKKTVESDL